MSIKYTVLIVEDENNIASFITTILTANGYNVLKAVNGSQAIMMISSHAPDVVILDLGLPDMDGLAIIKSVREWSQLPIIVVSARSHERDKVSALDLGADDYITKPFGTSELLARLRTTLRHATRGDGGDMTLQGKFVTGELTVDFDKRHAFVSDRDIHLTQNEFKLVALLAKYAGRVLTYDFLIKNIWGPNAPKDNQILRVNMANIRRKLEVNPAEPRYIFTEIGVGYRMAEGE